MQSCCCHTCHRDSKALESARRCRQRHGMARAILCGSRNAAPAAAPVDVAATGSSRYAIVNLGGMQQLLWEGQTYACSKQAVKQVRAL